MRKFKIGDIVKVNFNPNNGEMCVQGFLGKMFGGSEENPMYECKYYNEEKKEYVYDRFLESSLLFIRNEGS